MVSEPVKLPGHKVNWPCRFGWIKPVDILLKLKAILDIYVQADLGIEVLVNTMIILFYLFF